MYIHDMSNKRDSAIFISTFFIILHPFFPKMKITNILFVVIGDARDLLVLKSTLVINEYFSIYFIFVESLASVTIIEEFYRNVIMKTCLF